MKDIPVIEPQRDYRQQISNKKTGEEYKDDSEWKAKGVSPESDIRKDVRVSDA